MSGVDCQQKVQYDCFVAYIYKLQIVIRTDFVKLGRNFLFVDNGLVCFLNVDKDGKARQSWLQKCHHSLIC